MFTVIQRNIIVKYEGGFPETAAADKILGEKFSVPDEKKIAIISYNMPRLFSTFIAKAILNNHACLIIAFL